MQGRCGIRPHGQAHRPFRRAGIDGKDAQIAVLDVVGDDAGRNDPDGIARSNEGAAKGVRHGLDLVRQIGNAVDGQELGDKRANDRRACRQEDRVGTQGRKYVLPSPKQRVAAANDRTMWLLFSNTKVITAAGIWALVEEGAITFSDRIAA